MEMINKKELAALSIKEILEAYPYTESFFREQQFPLDMPELTIRERHRKLSMDEREDLVLSAEEFLEQLSLFISNMQEFLGEGKEEVESLTLLPGRDKDSNRENYEKITIRKGEIVSIVGPTGSGKSRLLADIEWVADADTPTGRIVLINEKKGDKKWRLSGTRKLVAQLSQNMNFVMDLTVEEFLYLHAESRLVENEKELVERIIVQANELAGEKFSRNTPVTSLSGGQSRALMIADTAILSSSPIILIDEIENAGIDREKALKLLVGEEKIVLMATHDPILALMADRRIVINNGGIINVLETSAEEKEILKELQLMDERLNMMRNALRYGKQLDSGKMPVRQFSCL